MATAQIPGSKDTAPAKSPETQMETLRRVIPEMAAGSLKGNSVDLLGMPVDLINQVLGAVGLKSAQPVGGADSLRNILGIKSTSEDTAAEVGGSFISPAGAAKAMIVGAARVLKNDGMAIDTVSKIMQTAKDADAMQMAGMKAQVFDTTGTYAGREGKVRAVISDAEAKINPGAITVTPDASNLMVNTRAVTTLEDLLRHDELFTLYPELKSYRVRSDPNMRVNEAMHQGESRVMTFGPSSSAEKLRQMTLHEIQHAVQKVEGFLGGGSPGEFLRLPRPSGEKIQRIQKMAGDPDKSLAEPARRFLNKLNEDYERAFKSYKLVPGEQEARFTEQNANVPTKELNAKIYNLISEDTPTSLWQK